MQPASQFSREYARLFGAPSKRDAISEILDPTLVYSGFPLAQPVEEYPFGTALQRRHGRLPEEE